MTTETTAINDLVVDKLIRLRHRLVHMDELTSRGTVPPDALIPDLVPGDADRILISGPSYAGKSWLTYELVYSLGTGLPFLGLYPLSHTKWRTVEWVDADKTIPLTARPETVEGIGQRFRTLYVQLENSAFSMEQRGAAIQRDRGGGIVMNEDGETSWEGLPANLVDILNGEDIDLLNHVDLNALMQLAATYDLIVLDSLYRFTSQSLNDENTAKLLIANIEALRTEARVRVVAIHHSSTKGEGGFASARESMGSTFITSAYWDHELRLKRSARSGVLTITPVSRDHAYPVRKVKMVDAGTWETADDDAAAETQTMRNWLGQAGVWPTLKGNGVTVEGWTQRDIGEATQMSQSSVSRILNILATEHDSSESSESAHDS